MKTDYKAIIAETVALFKDFGLGDIKIALDPECPVADLVKYQKLQVRDSGHVAPKANVNQYAEQMKAGTVFPPVVVTRNGYVADGNTRIAARAKIKSLHMPVLILDIDYDKKNLKVATAIESFAGLRNQQAGQRLSDKEALTLAVRMTTVMGWNSARIAEFLGMKAAAVTKLVNIGAATAKLDDLGVKANGMPSPVLAALGAKATMDLNDDPYQKLAELTRDANLGPKEVSDLTKEVKAQKGDTAALAFLTDTRSEMAERIRHLRMHGRHYPSASGKLRRSLGFVLTKENLANPTKLIETDPAKQQEHWDAVNKAIDVLEAVLAAQAVPAAVEAEEEDEAA